MKKVRVFWPSCHCLEVLAAVALLVSVTTREVHKMVKKYMYSRTSKFDLILNVLVVDVSLRIHTCPAKPRSRDGSCQLIPSTYQLSDCATGMLTLQQRLALHEPTEKKGASSSECGARCMLTQLRQTEETSLKACWMLGWKWAPSWRAGRDWCRSLLSELRLYSISAQPSDGPILTSPLTFLHTRRVGFL